MSEAPPRAILHLDLDAFYAAVEVRENPSLLGKPVIVGADPKGGTGRGVVCTASYEARRHGVHSAQPISQAWRACPHGVFVRPRMDLYAQVAEKVFAIYERYTDCIEPLSIDEAFLDVTDSRLLFGDAEVIGRRIQAEVEEEQRLTVSIGVAHNKFLAKIASDLRKPRGLVIVEAGREREFLCDLPVERIFGAGKKTAARLHELGLHTIGQVAQWPIERLTQEFSEKLGAQFFELSRGIDSRAVVPGRERKSLGKELTFEHDVADRSEVLHAVLHLVEDVCFELRRQRLSGRCVTLKLRTADFHTVTRSETVREPMNTTGEMLPIAKELFEKADTTRLPIRLVGVSTSHFAPRPGMLFQREADRSDQRIAKALDSVAARFGREALRRASLLRP